MIAANIAKLGHTAMSVLMTKADIRHQIYSDAQLIGAKGLESFHPI